MKKSIIFGMLAAAFLSMGLTSCGDKEYTDSKVTNFVDLALKGDPVVSTPLNSDYVDEGFTATINGEDASDHVVTSNNVNTAELGPYSVTYTATNDDGYSSSVTRTVYVGDYTPGNMATGSQRTNTSSGAVTAYSGYTIPVTTDGNGNYWVEDLLGGYYEQRAGYGSAFSMPGFLRVNADNTVDLTAGGSIAAWGDSYDKFENGVYDPATKTITYDITYAGSLVFHVILQL